MFKRGVITDEISQDFRVAAELATRFGLDGLEIRSVWEKGPQELGPRDIAEIKAILDGSGLAACGISAPFYKCGIDDAAAVTEHLELLKRCAALANELGPCIVRGFTFWKKGSFDELFPLILSRYEAPLAILERQDAILAIEFDDHVLASNARKVARVVEAIGSPRVKALWDPGNDVWDAEGEVPYPESYEIIRPYLAHVHLKDARKLPSGEVESCPFGKGDVDFPGALARLLREDYRGYAVMETHYRPSRALGADLLALPKGSAFSYRGYEATEESLRNWSSMMEGLRDAAR